ncbi:MAG: alpha/beta hydrolase [Deltaproteobacteria bacterium HGW-Deltaproteobacteria-20]|nr:MAG: alpha/beta hydrolase [Deltaproteobacteria bacterium HGW-Deltaproteobacteria-20]
MSLALPPPPEHPTRPPPVAISGEEPFRIETSDGQSLEARLRLPSDVRRVVVLCHPHPLYGGTMHNAVIVALAKALADAGGNVGSLRFNFRGVEGSTGGYEEGRGEKLDVIAAVDGLRNLHPHVDVTIVGYSFGSWVGLRAAWDHPEVDRVALIAPAARIFSYAEDQECRRPLPTEIIVGDKDDFVPVTSARKLARYLGAQLHVIDGADHFFVGYRRVVAKMLLPFVAPEAES